LLLFLFLRKNKNESYITRRFHLKINIFPNYHNFKLQKIKKMFVPDYSESIPGYTGHRQEQLNVEADTQQPGGPRKHIPGYGGYVPGVKSENVFGQTYGKTSFASSAGSFPKGIDQDPHVKFNSVMKGEFIDHSLVAHTHETTAQIVGVSRGQDMYKKAIPPTQVHAFYGSAAPVDTTDE